ncbi:hypothetical protein D9M71_182480 [compost metagenome]
METEALDGFRDAIGNRQRVAKNSAVLFAHPVRQALLHLPQGADEGCRIAAIETQRIDSAAAQMLLEAFQSFMGAQFGALFDAPAVGDHHRQRHATVFRTPPARNPVAAALFFGGAVGEKCHQGFSRQRHVCVLQLGEAQVAALGDPPGGMRIDMTAQWDGDAAVAGLGVAVEVADQAGQPDLSIGIGPRLLRMQVAGQHVERLDRRHAMPLPHEPATGLAGQGIQGEIAGISRHHVQRPAGVPLRLGLEILGLQWLAIHSDATGIGHVRHQPEPGAGQAIQGGEQPIDGRKLALQSGLDQLMSHAKNAGLGRRAMLKRTTTTQPFRECRFGGRMGCQLVRTGQYLGHPRLSVWVYEKSRRPMRRSPDVHQACFRVSARG